jgi:hypothetical protein
VRDGSAPGRQRHGGTHPGDGSMETRWKTAARAGFHCGGGLPWWPATAGEAVVELVRTQK